MPKTLTDILGDVRDRLDEEVARRWDDTQLTRWINEGARDIARRTEVLQDRLTTTAVAGTQEYTLPTDMVRVYRVEFVPTGATSTYTLDYRDFNSLDGVWWSQKTTRKGTPFLYTIWGFPPSAKLILYPIPDPGGTITVYYYRLPVEAVNGGDNLELPEGWHDLLSDYCEYKALRKDADPRWRESKQLFEENLGNLFDVTRRWTDQAGYIDVATTTLPSWLVEGW